MLLLTNSYAFKIYNKMTTQKEINISNPKRKLQMFVTATDLIRKMTSLEISTI